MPRSLAVALAGLVAAAGLARAQGPRTVETTLDAGAARVGFAGGGTVTAFSVAPAARWAEGLLDLRGGGSFSGFDSGGWSVQGAATASLYTPARRGGGLRGELAATAGGNAQGDGTGGGQALVVGRAHAQRRAGGLWLGAGGGRSWDASHPRATLLAEAGAWGAWRAAEVQAVATPTRVADSAWYTDAVAAASLVRGRVTLDGFAGARLAHRRATRAGWGGAGATYALTPRVALVLGVGSYPVDPTQGFPGGRYASAAVRTALGHRRLTSPPPPPAGAPVAAAPARRAGPDTAPAGPVRAFEHRAAADGRRVLRVRAPGARVVEVAGDFTDWEPVRLTSAGDGWWEARLPIAAGMRQLNVRVNEGEWLVPPGVRRRADGLGGVVGVLLVQ